jgi:asparagine synthase (glutamine-hydrolysing)
VRLVERLGWLACTPLYAPLRRAIEWMPARRETRVGSRVNQLKRAIRGLDGRPMSRYANWMRITDDRALSALLSNGDAERCIQSLELYLWQHRGPPRDSDDLNAHLRTEWSTSLPDDMLAKVDLMSMAHSLEVRSPFLDFRVVDLVAPLPSDWKLHGWRKKHLLLEAFRDDLPPLLHDRPKRGFEVPVGPWLRGPLYPMARQFIEDDRALFDGWLSRTGALALLDAHRAGRADHTSTLWALVALLSWHQRHAPQVGLASDASHAPAAGATTHA